MEKVAVKFLFLLVFSVFIGYPYIGNTQDSAAPAESGENAPLESSTGTGRSPESDSDSSDNTETSVSETETTEPKDQNNESGQNATIDELAKEQKEQDDPSTVRISKLKVEGAKAITKQQIEQSIGTDFPSFRFWVKKPVFDEEVLKDDMIRIQRLYASSGYYDTKATYELKYNKDNTRVEIKINIVEGEPVKLTELLVDFKGELSDKIRKEVFKAIPLKADTIFSPRGYEQTKGVIAEILANNGYPKAQIDGEALVNRREKWARAEFTVDPGLIFTFGTISVSGNDTVKSYIVEREREFKKGEIYSLKKLNKTQANIFQLGLFRSVVIDPVFSEEDQVVNIEIVVKERKHGSVKIGGGFGTEDKLRGQLIWTQRNFFGGGRRLEVAGKFSFITQRVETSLIQPYIAGKNSELSGTLNFQRDDVPSFTGRSFLSSVRMQKNFKDYYSTYGSLNLQFSNIEDSATRTPLERSQENVFLTFINMGFERDTTDNLLNPTRGTVISTGLESSFTALASDVNYLKGTVELRGYKKLRNIVFAKKFTIGVIQPFGGTGTFDIPIFKRFFAGGSTSMRGFPFQELGPLDDNNDPLGGNSLLIGSFEVRYPLYGDFGGVTFLDYGNVYTREWEFDLGDIKYAPGVGLRYDTIIGPIRFDVGYALNPEPGIRRVQFWISIGQAF
jgi:outer membrane protein insertion porin family